MAVIVHHDPCITYRHLAGINSKPWQNSAEPQSLAVNPTSARRICEPPTPHPLSSVPPSVVAAPYRPSPLPVILLKKRIYGTAFASPNTLSLMSFFPPPMRTGLTRWSSKWTHAWGSRLPVSRTYAV